MPSKLVQRHKQATVLVTEATLNQALSEARELVKQIGHDDSRAQELQQLYNDIAGVLTTEGVQRSGDLNEFFDDTSNPGMAQELKAAVDRIAELRNEISRPEGPVSQPVNASQEGTPMGSRLFARKKSKMSEEDELATAPEAIAGDAPEAPLPEAGADLDANIAPPVGAPAAPPVGAPPTAGNSFANLPTEALTAIIESLTKIDQFETNPAILGAIEQVAEELKNRPVQPAPVEGAPKAASSKTAVAPEGWEGTVKEMKKDKSIDNPFALAHWMKGEGYTPHKASFMLRRNRGAWLQTKFAAATMVPPVNEDTLEKVEGQPHEVKEIGEAHSDREGVEKAEKHDSHPGTSGTTIKSPQDMEKQAKADSEISKALKQAEQLEKKLGEMYLDAKPIMRANASAAVCDAVESIYDAKNKFAEAKKVLNRHEMQANAEEEAQEQALRKEKKASMTLGLALVAAE